MKGDSKTNRLEDLIEPLREKYAPRLLEDFLDYWTEPDAKGKERWQKEKTWQTSRRVARWKRQQERWDWQRSQRNIKVDEKPQEERTKTNNGFSSMADLIK